MAEDVDGTLAALAEIGYREVEMAGTYGMTPAAFRRSLDAAVSWQRRERPRFGSLARDWGMLTEPQIAAIMSRKSHSEGIAQASVRLGYLSRTQAEAVLTMQTRRQKQLGVYLVALGAVPYDQLTTLLQEHVRHNAWALSYAA